VARRSRRVCGLLGSTTKSRSNPRLEGMGKLRDLPADALVEVDDFVDCLRQKQPGR
jgi:hypothetical protein